MILDGIGSTECLHIFIGNRLDDYRPGTSGKPVIRETAGIARNIDRVIAQDALDMAL